MGSPWSWKERGPLFQEQCTLEVCTAREGGGVGSPEEALPAGPAAFLKAVLGSKTE